MSQLKDALVQYFRGHIKEGNTKCLGVEVEHFIVDRKTKRAVPYEGEYGVRFVLEQLIREFPDAERLKGEDFFGFTTEDFSITIEPAAQLEISIAAREEIQAVQEIYERFREKLQPVLDKLDYEALNVGCQPVSKVRDLKLIPKKRYDLMNRHFEKTGTGGIEMMRGSASTQVSIDYFSEEDFRKKIQAAYLLMPLFQLLNDNAPFFEGKELEGYLQRTGIWRRTDDARTGILPHIFNSDYGFEDYADFLCNMPPIFLQKKGEIVPTGMATSEEVFSDREVTEEDVLHLLSMAFPDVRLKSYLEIRGADSVPLERVLAYCGLVKGMLYSQKGLDFCQRFIREHQVQVEDILKTQDRIMQKGWEGCFYEIPAHRFAKQVIEIAKEELPASEREYLTVYEKSI